MSAKQQQQVHQLEEHQVEQTQGHGSRSLPWRPNTDHPGQRYRPTSGTPQDGHCHRASGTGHQVDQARCGVHTALAVYGHDHRVCGCVTNCVTITAYDNGLPWILRDV
jgi:hypothetical protein